MRAGKTGAHGVEEAVALSDEAVEVGERLHPLRTIAPIVCDDREPEPKLGQPHRGAVPVHPEEIAMEHLAAECGSMTAVRMGRCESLERAEQERPRADGRIEHSERPDRSPRGALALREPSLGLGLRAAESVGHERDQRRSSSSRTSAAGV